MSLLWGGSDFASFCSDKIAILKIVLSCVLSHSGELLNWKLIRTPICSQLVRRVSDLGGPRSVGPGACGSDVWRP